MNSQWINLDKLGKTGAEPDLIPVHRETQSLDYASNVRPVGDDIGNAGGYALVVSYP